MFLPRGCRAADHQWGSDRARWGQGLISPWGWGTSHFLPVKRICSFLAYICTCVMRIRVPCVNSCNWKLKNGLRKKLKDRFIGLLEKTKTRILGVSLKSCQEEVVEGRKRCISKQSGQDVVQCLIVSVLVSPARSPVSKSLVIVLKDCLNQTS